MLQKVVKTFFRKEKCLIVFSTTSRTTKFDKTAFLGGGVTTFFFLLSTNLDSTVNVLENFLVHFCVKNDFPQKSP